MSCKALASTVFPPKPIKRVSGAINDLFEPSFAQNRPRKRRGSCRWGSLVTAELWRPTIATRLLKQCLRIADCVSLLLAPTATRDTALSPAHPAPHPGAQPNSQLCNCWTNPRTVCSLLCGTGYRSVHCMCTQYIVHRTRCYVLCTSYIPVVRHTPRRTRTFYPGATMD